MIERHEGQISLRSSVYEKKSKKQMELRKERFFMSKDMIRARNHAEPFE